MQELQEEEKARNRKNYSPPYQNQIHSDGGGGFNQAAHDAGKASAAAQEQSNRDYARGKFSQGGIASL